MDTWLHSSPYAQLPPFTVIGGHDCDGAPIYVGRSFHEGDNLPAKVIPSKGSAFVAWGGAEISKQHYEVLVGQGYAWVPCYGGSVPPNAVNTGVTSNGEPLYIGRGHHAGSLCVGKIHPSHGCLYIPFGGQEVRLNTYEVLVRDRMDQWVGASPHCVPPGAVVAGHDTDHDPIYIGRAMHEAHKWVPSTAYTSIPPNAVVGGNDTDGSTIYVGRALHNGEMLVAKVIPSKQIAFVSFRGEELPKDNFEVLCCTNVAWQYCHDHNIPENAIICGQTSLGQSVYIGRGHYEGSLTIGKVSAVHRALFIPFNGVERRLESYEILVEEDHKIGWNMSSAVSTPPPPPPPFLPLHTADIHTDVKPAIYPALVESSSPFVPVPPAASVTTTTFDPPPPYAPPQSTPASTIPPKPVLGVAVLPMPTMSTPALSTPAYSTATVHPTPASSTPVITTPAYCTPVAPTSAFPTPVITTPAHSNIGASMPAYATPAGTTSTYSTPAQTAPMPPPASERPSYQPQPQDTWVNASPSYVPSDIVCAGHDTDLSTILVCRAFHEGNLIPGKYIPTKGCAYISWMGHEIPKHNYEVLIGDHKYHWVPANDGYIPPGAVKAGHTSNDEPLFVGRAHYCGSLTPGRIQHSALFIPFSGSERRVTQYEVLVRKNDYHREQHRHLHY